MIAQLTGTVTGVEEGRCIIDVNGVGYLVNASTRTLVRAAQPARHRQGCWWRRRCGRTRSPCTRFAEAAERDWFRLLTTVQGVGAKVALGLLSALSPKDIVAAVAAGDRASLTRAPGVGAKLADAAAVRTGQPRSARCPSEQAAAHPVVRVRDRSSRDSLKELAPRLRSGWRPPDASALSACFGNLGYRRDKPGGRTPSWSGSYVLRPARRGPRKLRLDALNADPSSVTA